MIPRQTPQAPTRDDLAQQVTFLPWTKWRGAGGVTADDALALAKKRASEGYTQKEIYDETGKLSADTNTGLSQNAAGQWVTEIPDADARLTLESLQWLKEGMTGKWGGDTGEMNLDRLLKHDLLYDYAPEMREVKTSLSQPYEDDPVARRAEGGYGSPQSPSGENTSMGRIAAFGKPGTDPTSGEHMSVSDLLLHEVQHPLQWKYGMPMGGNQNDPNMQKVFREKMRPQANEARKMAETERESFARDYAQREGSGPSLETMEAGRKLWRDERPEQALILDQAVKVGGHPGMRANEVTPKTPKSDPLDWFGQYQSLSGEQMARLAAKRKSMSIKELNANPWFMQEPGTDQLSPAFQLLRTGPNDYSTPDLRWGLANTMVKR